MCKKRGLTWVKKRNKMENSRVGHPLYSSGLHMRVHTVLSHTHIKTNPTYWHTHLTWARLEECLPGMHEALRSSLVLHDPGVMMHTCNPSIWEKEDQKFKVSPGHMRP